MFLKRGKNIIIVLFSFILLCLLFSFHLTSVPKGITVDEAAFGYNAVLLSRTLHDENGRKLPVFVLSLGGNDWRQPVVQYSSAFLFRLFGASLFNLRMVSVITTAISVILIYFLAREILNNKIFAYVSAFFLATTPIILIQSHLGLDNITPIPFVIAWLLGIILFSKSKKKIYLFISAFSLGISYYSYKSMRIFVPVWVFSTLIYLLEPFLKNFSKENLKKVAPPVLTFVLTILPFFAIIPYLEFLYAGAVLNRTTLEINSIFNFAGSYLSNFDPSFLFIKGDDMLFHSTGRHGMYLLLSLPFFILGINSSWKKSSFWKFLIVSFFLGPLMFGYIGQVHRASRLLAMVPIYSLISVTGFLVLWQKKNRIILFILSFLFIFNYFDFANYYFGSYAKDTEAIFNCFECKNKPFNFLKTSSEKLKLNPVVDEIVLKGLDPTRDFARSIYFTQGLSTWNGKERDFPNDAILMTDDSNVAFLKRIGHIDRYYFYVRDVK